MKRPMTYALFGVGRTCLYVGCTENLGQRLVNHSNTKTWWEVATIEAEGSAATRVELLAKLHDEARRYYGDTAVRFVRVEVRRTDIDTFVGSALAMRREVRL